MKLSDKSRITVSLLSGLFLLMQVPALSAQTIPDTGSAAFQEVEKIDCQIIDQECQIFKVSTALRTECGRNRAGRRIRMLMAQTTNYTCTATGLMINMIYNWAYYVKNTGAPPVVQLAATTPRFVGKAIYLADLMLETTLQAKDHKRQDAAGFNPKITLQKVKELTTDVDSLMARRTELMKQLGGSMSAAERNALQLEGKVLDDGRHLSTDEYAMLDGRQHGISARSRTFNTLTMIKKGDATWGADFTRIIGGSISDSFYSGPASISTTISGAMSTFDVYVEMAALHIWKHGGTKHAAKTLETAGQEDLQAFDADKDHFTAAVQEIPPGDLPVLARVMNAHAQIYESMGGVAEAMEYQRSKELHHQKMHDIHSIIYHAIYGGSKLSRGSWLIYVGFHYLKNRFPRRERPWVGRESSLLNGIAGIDNFTGAAYRVADFFTYDTIQFLHRKRDRAERMADSAMINSRWDMLDTMQQDANNTLSQVVSAKIMPKTTEPALPAIEPNVPLIPAVGPTDTNVPLRPAH
jgi:hypothetical protein